VKLKKCLGFRKPCDNEVSKDYKYSKWCEKCTKHKVELLKKQLEIMNAELNKKSGEQQS